jgi:hypothetical protein
MLLLLLQVAADGAGGGYCMHTTAHAEPGTQSYL